MKRLFARFSRRALLLAAALVCAAVHAEPKHILVVTATQGYRHSSIPLAEKVIAAMGETTGLWDVDYARGGADGKGSDDLQQKMTRDALKKYDAIIFANTTGDLPLPDRDALIDFVKSGKGFVGTHSASDTFHGWPGYIQMLGGEFRAHYAQAQVDCINLDRDHPATRHLGPFYTVFDEIYVQKNFDRTKVHGLLALDKHPNTIIPGDYPISWTRQIGKGRLFYTSLGHREDVWLSDVYQKHLLGGIKFALGLEKADSEPQDTEYHLSKEESREGFKALFDGTDLKGWHLRRKEGNPSWSVQNGILVNIAGKNESGEDVHGTDLVSDEKFKDFIVRYEYMIPTNSNSGFYLRGRHEIQILDDGNRNKALGPGSNGGIYTIAGPVEQYSRKPGQWQTVEARMKGNLVTVYLNGVKIHDKVVVDHATGSELDRNVNDPGPFMLQGDHGTVAFRKIRVKKL
jgi:type 1 glutamine amidotransferase